MTDTTVDQDADETAPDRKPLGRRIADGWNSLNVAGKAVMIGGGVIIVVGGLIVLAGTRAADADLESESDEDVPAPVNNRRPTNASGGYNQCTHGPCSKKMEPRITTHDCCGRCRYSSYQDCWAVSQRAYDGPGGFAHNYSEGVMTPGICAVCREPGKGHWQLDGAETRVLAD